MELYQLRGFLAVAQEKSFTHAANKLGLTQPALSSQVKRLEQELGEPLFERIGKRIYLTPAGRVLQERTESILELVTQTEQDIAAVKGLRGGEIVIAASESYCIYVLPGLMQLFLERFPEVTYRFIGAHSSEVVSLVTSGEADFGLGTLPAFSPHIQTQPLFWREDVAICAPSHPLANETEVSQKMLLKHPLLLLTGNSHSRRLIDQTLLNAEIAPQIGMELESVEVVKRFAGIGLGVAIVPGFSVEQEVANGGLHAIRLEWLEPRSVGVIRRQQDYLPPAAEIFLRLLRNHVPNLWLCYL